MASFIRTLVVGAIFCLAAVDADGRSKAWQHDNRWVDSWTSMPQLVEPANLPSPPFVSRLLPIFSSVEVIKLMTIILQERHGLRISRLYTSTDSSSLTSIDLTSPPAHLQRFWGKQSSDHICDHRTSTQ